MALEVAEAAVVGDDLEPVAHRLPAAAGAVAAVSALAGQLADQLGALQRIEGLDPVADLGLRGARRLEQRGREQVLLAALDADQLDRGRVALGRGGPAPAAPPRARWPAGARAGRRSTRRRDRALDAPDEARDHLGELGEDHVAVLARLRQRRGHQTQEQLLVGLARGEDADVAERRGREDAPQQVERLGADRAPPRALWLVAPAATAPPPRTEPTRGRASRSETARPWRPRRARPARSSR